MSKLTKLIKLALVATGIAAFAANAQAARTYTADLTSQKGSSKKNASKSLATDAENGTKIKVYVEDGSGIDWGDRAWSKGKYKIGAGRANVTRIEMTCTVKSLSGEGWSQTVLGCVWTGCVPGYSGVPVEGEFTSTTKLVVTTDEPTPPEVPLIETDNDWQTVNNPFAKPTTLSHWLSNLCYHKCWTNALGGAEGEMPHWRHVYWFTGANTKPTSNDPAAENYFKVARTNSVPCQTWGNVNDNETCLAQIEDAATYAKGKVTGDNQVGKAVEVAICRLLRPFESRRNLSPKAQGGVNYGENFLFLSNVCQTVGTQFRVSGLGNGASMGWFDPVVIERCQPFGPFFSGYNFTVSPYHPLRFCNINNNMTPTDIIDIGYDIWGSGLNLFLDDLKTVPTNWGGAYRLAAGTDAQAKAIGDDWPMFDEDVYLDRGDVLLMRFAGHALNTACLLLKAYKIPGTYAGKAKKFADPDLLSVEMLGDNYQTIGFTGHRERWVHHAVGYNGMGYRGDQKPRIIRCGYKERIERIFHDAFHVTTNLCAYIDDEKALGEARSEFEMALECFLDADAFITGEWPSVTTHNYGGIRDADQLHLFEFAEAADDEDGGEWNIAGYRELARKAYASLKNQGKQASVQPIDLVQMGKLLDIHAGSKGNATAEEHGVIDFSSLGKNRNGVIAVDVNPLFNGEVTRKIVKDYQTCITTNGAPGHWVATRVANVSNYVHDLQLYISAKTLDTKLAGVLPDNSLVNDLVGMKMQFPANGEKNRSHFAQMVYPITCERTSLKAGQSTNLVGGVYMAVPSKFPGGVFQLANGATLMGTNVTFASNKTTSSGGAIYNAGTLVLKDAVFAGNQANFCGALYNLNTVTLEDVTFNGNEATSAGGAIFNSSGSTLNLDGPITLVTSTDTICSRSVINWNLTGGKAGCLNGYDKFINDEGGTLKLTVENYTDLPKDFVIATGDLSWVTGKDTFSITNISGGAEISITIGSNEVTDGETCYQLVTEPAGETTHLVLKVCQPTEPIVTAPITAVDNVTLGVYTNGFLSTETSTPGVWNAWSNKIATVVYTANEGYCFADGTTVVTNQLNTKVNPAVVKEGEVVPGAAGKSTLRLGVVAQRYPWNGTVDVGYKATYWLADKKGAIEVTVGETVMTNEFVITGIGTVIGTAAVDLSEIAPEAKGQAKFKAVVK